MTIDEIKQLIPFYAANTLRPEERKEVEDQLRHSEELRKELEFWKKTSEASRLQALFAAKGHPSTEELVDYAEWTMADAGRRLEINRHLQDCTTCSEAYELLKVMAPVPHPPRQTLLERMVEFAKSIRPVYAVPAVVAAVLLAVFLVPRLFRPPQEAQLWLTYQMETRSESPSQPPVLHLRKDTEKILFTVALPHSSDPAVTYSVSLRSETTQPALLASFTKPFFHGVPYDSLRMNVGAYIFSGEARDCQLIVAEDSTSVTGSTLPPFVMAFTIERDP